MTNLTLRSLLRAVRRIFSSERPTTPWGKHPLPSFSLPPAMLSLGEVKLLHWLTAEYYAGRGEIIDAGCFLGGSSIALAHGLQCNPRLRPHEKRKRIVSYDLFLADWYTIKGYLPDRREGDDFRDLFSQNIELYEQYIDVVQGDIRLIEWGSRPIEILFIDVAKQPDINDILVQRLFPHLCPNLSYVIHQDYIHEWLPWIHVTMEYFTEYFAVCDYVPYGSAVFRLVKQIPSDVCAEFSVARLSPEVQIKLIDQAIQKIPVSEYRKIITVTKVRLLHHLGRVSEACRLLDELARQTHPEPRVTEALEGMKDFLSRY